MAAKLRGRIWDGDVVLDLLRWNRCLGSWVVVRSRCMQGLHWTLVAASPIDRNTQSS